MFDRLTGTVKRCDVEKGYGFITSNDSQIHLVHHAQEAPPVV